MKKLLFIMALFLSGYGMAQEYSTHQSTNAPDNARYEIVQSELTAKNTFKLDKHTGLTYQLVKGGNKKEGFYHTWQMIHMQDHYLDKIEPDTVSYQIFTSGMAVKFTYLMNIHTGATWQMVVDKNDNLYWQAM